VKTVYRGIGLTLKLVEMTKPAGKACHYVKPEQHGPDYTPDTLSIQLHLSHYPDQLTGPIRVKCLAQGRINRLFKPSWLGDLNQQPFGY
jgi:hypothetical protein